MSGSKFKHLGVDGSAPNFIDYLLGECFKEMLGFLRTVTDYSNKKLIPSISVYPVMVLFEFKSLDMYPVPALFSICFFKKSQSLILT